MQTAVAPYTTRGGNSAGCAIPTGIAAVQVNLGALSYSGGAGWVKGWASGTTEPLASLVNDDRTGPVANMVTLPVNASGHVDLRTKASAHLYVDIAGYYVKPLYVAVNTGGVIYAGIASGVVSTSRVSTGVYTVTFNRNVRACPATTSDIIFSHNRDVSADATYVGITSDPSTVTVEVTDTSNAPVDTFFSLRLTC